MKTLAKLCFLSFYLLSCIQQHDIEAEFTGLGNDTLSVEYMSLSQSRDWDSITLDTIYPANGVFAYNVPIKESVLLQIDPHMGKIDSGYYGFYRNHLKFITILLKPGDKIFIKGEIEDLYTDFHAKGSSFNEEHSLIRQQYIEEVSEAAQISLVIDSLAEEGGNNKLIEELDQQRRSIYKVEDQKQIEFITNNWDSELSAYYLTQQMSVVVAKYYPLLTEDVRNGVFKVWLEQELEHHNWELGIEEAKSRIQPGEIAPDFLLESIQGALYSLDSVKKDFVVLDFWSSWCAPCVEGFSRMTEYFNKYSKRIEFIGIACYDTEEDWKKSVAEHDLEWVQLISLQKSTNDAALKYGVRVLPTKFILDKEKRIISRSKGEADEFYETLDELMKQE